MDLKKSVSLRVVVSTLILGSGAFLYYISNSTEEAFYLSVILAAVYFLSITYLLLEPHLSSVQNLFKYAQVTADTIIVSAVVLITGLAESPFIFLYPLIIIFAGIFISKAASYIVAGLSCTVYLLLVTIVFTEHYENVRFHSAAGWDFLVGESGFFVVYFHLIGFVLIAMLAGYLAQRAATAATELGESKRSFDILKNLHENILQSLTSGVITLDFDGNIISVNQSGLRLLGYETTQHLVGRNLEEIIEGVDIHELVDTKREEIVYRTAEGSYVTLGFSASLLKDTDGNKQGYTIVFQDLTEIKELEERAMNSEKLELLEQLAAGLAHEIRNPISSISGSVELITSEIEVGDDNYRLAKVASREIERVNLIIEDFLILTTPVSAYKTSTIELGHVIKETVDSFLTTIERKDISIDMELDKSAFINANSMKIKQVFWNLLSNSVDSMEKGGKISIKCYKNNNKVKILFSDEGTGIDQSIVSRIFDPFFTTKQVGTGLGLAIVQKIVKGYSGEIELMSRKSKGCDFFITFPGMDMPPS